jgi:sugar phosphate permease
VNRAFYIIVVPAIVTTFGWVTFGWGWRLAAVITGAEIVLVIATVIFLVRRQNTQKAGLKKASSFFGIW